ncbi:MAG: hypothetical protein LKM36_09145 [Flavobacteriales bacterium]|jgi:hypothetical protein|nr:hypothetical protein [Flavobacteriales bacterium]
MDIAAKKVELVQHLLSIMDEKTLMRVATFFKKEIPVTADTDDEITDEEFAEFEEMRAKRDRGEVRFLSEKESMAEVRRLIAQGKG